MCRPSISHTIAVHFRSTHTLDLCCCRLLALLLVGSLTAAFCRSKCIKPKPPLSLTLCPLLARGPAIYNPGRLESGLSGLVDCRGQTNSGENDRDMVIFGLIRQDREKASKMIAQNLRQAACKKAWAVASSHGARVGQQGITQAEKGSKAPAKGQSICARLSIFQTDVSE